MVKLYIKYFLSIFTVIILLSLSGYNLFAAGGSCTFSDACGGATNFTWCSPVTADNSSCSVSANCQANDNTTDCNPPWAYDYGNLDECDIACQGTSPCGNTDTYIDASGECSCTVTTEVMGISCFISATQSDPVCGTIENTNYTRLCIPATYVGSCAQNISITGISCSGGGASLQWSFFPSTITCANLLTQNPSGAGMLIACENGRTTNYATTATMVPGSCYLVMFDGNAKAACSWTFNMTAPTPTASFTQSATTACTAAPGNCVTFTNTSSCYSTTAVTWTATGLANQTTNNATFCWTTSGTKTVSLTIGSGLGACSTTATTSATVTVSVCCIPPAISLVSKTDVTCPGLTTGAININVTGATTPYTYAWSNTATTQDITNVGAGTYTVTVTEAGGCTATYFNTITAPAAWSVTNVTTNILCPCDATGAVDITVSGATGPYTYLWSSGGTSQDITLMVDGTYTVTITDSKSCTTTGSYAITEPAQITVALNSQTNVSCFSNCNGSVTIQASGGTSPYDYSNNGGAAWQYNDQAAAVTYSSLCAGSYTYTVRDANGCLTH